MRESAPPEVVALAEQRAERRAERDFSAADELRAQIAARGWTVVDAPSGGFALEPSIASKESERPRLRPQDVASVLADPPTMDVSVHWIVEGWPEDVVRGIDSFRRHDPGLGVHHVVVDLAGTPSSLWPGDVERLVLVEDAGWAAARNAGLRRSLGEIVILMDGSTEVTGPVLEPIRRVLADPGVGICGPFGIVTDDLREFREDPGPEVDAIEGYLMALRRETLTDVGLLDEKFRFYRTCDIEYSFRVKDSGRRAMVVAIPVRRHEHRMWSNTPAERRDQLSKRNYYRFLDRFRGRFDLTVAGEPD